MSARRGSGAVLDRLLGQLSQPEVPADLARRIVAETSRLPQHAPRESIMAAMPPPHRTIGRHAVGQRFAGLSAFAVAACLLLIMLPFGAQQPVANPQARVAAPAPDMVHPAQVAQAAQPVATRRQPSHATPAPKNAEKIAIAEADPVEPVEAEQPAEIQPLPAEPATVAQLAEVAGPKAVQGPPTPIDLIPANGRPMTGLGVVGVPGMGPTATMPRSR